ncbi:MAG: hypothetical protein PHY93_12340 [Bacteriovorax sp.]|nr:hypothetical protein [Bacteriovorax sp.]
MKKNLNLIGTGILLISLLFTVSCKLSQKIQNGESNDRIGNMTFSKERPFIKSELDIGRRICASLKQKREFFQTLYDRQERFGFQGTLVNCQGTTTLDTPFIASISNASTLEYSATTTRENYFRDIVTDQSGAMNDICQSLLVSDSVLNTVKSGSIKYTVNFLIAENFDRYDIRKELSNGQGGYTTSGAESISVITQKFQGATKFFGVEKDRIRFTSCDGLKFQTMRQTWKEALTNF